ESPDHGRNIYQVGERRPIMNKIWLIFQREFLNRVQKKSFLIATILIPLIFPAIIAVMIMVMLKQEEDSGAQKIQVVDVSGKFSFENSRRYEFVKVSTDLETAKAAFNKSDDFALLYIPQLDLANPQGIALYTKENPSIRRIEEIERSEERRVG